jgi:hypothetical protein
MGYDAYVRCNCWKEGKTKPHHFPFEVATGSDGSPSIVSPECERSYLNAECLEQYQLLWTWSMDACEHFALNYARERIANIWGMASFKSALEALGWEQYPILEEYLPSDNSGKVPPDQAALMIQELERLRQVAHIDAHTVLIDNSTSQVIHEYHEYMEGVGGVFLWDGQHKLEVGIDDEGLFIRNKVDKTLGNLPNSILFRAWRAEQSPYDPTTGLRLLAPESAYFELQHDQEEQILLRNLETDETYLSPTGVSLLVEETLPTEGDEAPKRNLKAIYPRLLYVERRGFGADAYAEIIESLLTVCRASVETGNPVCWC